MMNDEIPMTKEGLSTKPEKTDHALRRKLRTSRFVIPSFVLGHSSFVPTVFAAFALCVVAWNVAKAAEWRLPPETEKFRPGRGAELAIANCLLCHSADYVSTQPRLSRTTWKATVEKMRVKYGATIATNKIDEIVDYLAGTYGTAAKSAR